MDAKKPHEMLRFRLEKRAKESNKVKPSPSERSSKVMRKRLTRDAPAMQAIVYDCNRCPKEPCGMKLGDCGEKRRITKCKQCGHNYTYRFDIQNIFEYCTPCRLSKEREKGLI